MPKFFGKRSSAESSIKSYWPRSMRRLFESLKEIPWLSLTAVGTLLGVLILFCYFKSIDHFPSDFSALISLGAATAVCAVGLMGVLALGFFAPAAVYRNYASEYGSSNAQGTRPFSELELICLQLGGVGVTFGLIAYPAYRDCGTLVSWYSLIAVGSLLFWFLACLNIVLTKGTGIQRLERCNSAVGIAAASMAPCLIVIPLLAVFSSEYFHFWVLLCMFWALAILANTLAAKNLPVPALWLTGGLVIFVLFIAVPLATNHRSVFPEIVANVLGIRQEKPQELRIPTKTCQLIQSALGDALISKDVSCSEGVWSAVKAQTLSNVGEQWLIELVVTQSADLSKSSKLRLTIPRTDVQVVHLVDERTFEGKKVACEK